MKEILFEIRNKLGETLLPAVMLKQEGGGEIDISSIDFSDQNLHGCVFENLELLGGFFDSAKMEESDIRDTAFLGTWISDVDFSKSVIRNVEFYDVIAYGADFNSARFEDVAILGSNFSHCSFSNAIFSSVKFAPDNIHFQTDITNTDFGKCSFENVVFERVIYNSATVFPAGFVPERVDGLEKVEE